MTSGTSIDLVITGLDYKQFLDFKSMLLERCRGIKAIYPRAFAGNRAVMEVHMKGDAETL